MLKRIYLVIFGGLLITSDFAQTVITMQPDAILGKDATIDSRYPDINRGSQTDFDAVSWTVDGIPVTFRSLLEFDLSSIHNSDILNATLFLYNDPLSLNNNGDHASLTGSNIGWLRMITEEWHEDNVTWANQPAVTTKNQVVIPQSESPHQDYVINVTDLVQEMVCNPTISHGFMLLLQTEAAYRCLVFGSSDNIIPEHRPKLSVTYSSQDHSAGFFAVQQDHEVIFTDTSRFATSWYWSFGDSTFSIERNPVHYYRDPGIYKTCLIVSFICGSDTVCMELNVMPVEPIENQHEFNIYPNPTDGICYYDHPFQNNSEFLMEIFDPLGIKIQSRRITTSGNGNPQIIDLTSLSSNMYLIRLNRNGNIYTGKIIKISSR